MRILLLIVVLSTPGCAVDRERYNNSPEYQAGYKAGLQDGGAVHVGIAVVQSKVFK